MLCFPLDFETRGRIFPNLNLQTSNIMSIRNELILNDTLTCDAEPAFADRHLIFYWAGMATNPKAGHPPKLFIRLCAVAEMALITHSTHPRPAQGLAQAQSKARPKHGPSLARLARFWDPKK